MTSIGYVGYMVGSIVLGQFSDYYNTRALFGMTIGFNCVIYLFAYFYKGTSVAYWYILIIISQTLLGGPQALIGGPLSQDIVSAFKFILFKLTGKRI